MRLIDADELMVRLPKKKPGVANARYTDGYNDAIMRFRSMVHGSPTVDAVAEVRHGKWDDNAVAFYRKCTVCGCCVEWDKKPFLFGVGGYNYCPNCGARMDGGEDDGKENP